MFGNKNVLSKKLRQQFVVTCEDGLMFSGLLAEFDDEVYVFAHVKLLQGNAVPQPAPGVLYIKCAKVKYLQHTAVIDAPG